MEKFTQIFYVISVKNYVIGMNVEESLVLKHLVFSGFSVSVLYMMLELF